MPIISTVEAKSPRGKILYATIILALLIGSLSILYPFIVMVSGSLRSEVDEIDLDLIPSYFFDNTILYRKFLETKYNQNVAALNRDHGVRYFSFRDPEPPNGEEASVLAEKFERFLEEQDLPEHWQVLGGVYGVRTVPENLRELRKRLSQRFDRNLDAFAYEIGSPVSSWNTIVLPIPNWTSQRYDYTPNAIYETYFDLLEEAPPANRQVVSLSGLFLESMVYPVYGGTTTDAYNAAHKVPLERYSDFRLPSTAPDEDQPVLRAAWVEFALREVNPSFVVLDNVEDSQFQQFIQEEYEGNLAELNLAWGTDFDSFNQVKLPHGQWLSGQVRQDYEKFLEGQPVENLRLVGPEYAWREWLLHQPDTAAAGIDPLTARMPLAELEYIYTLENSGALRRAFAVRNYINVLDELVVEGRALVNTIVYCVLAIVFALLINPLAAYAMSRFKLPGSYKILLILMATMAFPPMVTLIPQFIVLRNLNLMNTFIALILPLAANGYLVFLLKGFFDSLPQELYEAARIDGAGEIRMFFQITMALSQPILAVLALMTFNSAYTAFLYPLLVAPSEDMWLISVWLFQFQARASSSGVFASVIIASIPTLIVFLMVQRVIMRGIVVPTEK